MGSEGVGHYQAPKDGLKGTELWQVQVKVAEHMEAKHKGQVIGSGANLARLANSMAYIGARFSELVKVRGCTLLTSDADDDPVC